MPAEADHAVVEAAKHFLSTFKTPGLILVAVSGGSDSKGLLFALHAAIARKGFSAFSLAVCTVDHGLRTDSADEARTVAQMCSDLGIPHVTRQWSGEKPATGLQAAARAARYALLTDAATSLGAQCIVTGHTADDQLETIAMRRARSDAPDAMGLAGMARGVLADRRVWVWRPFLALRRAVIRDYLQSLKQDWFEDTSNANRNFERVRIRQALQEDHHIDGQIDAWSHAGELRRRSGARVARLIQDHVLAFGNLAVRVDPALAAEIDQTDTRRALLVLTATVGGRAFPPAHETAERIEAFVKSGQDGRLTAGRVVFDRRRSGLYLYREARGLPVQSLAPGEMTIWDGRFIVSNDGSGAIELRGGVDPETLLARSNAAGLPEAILKRAARSALLPPLPSGASCRMEVSIPAYDTFLPCFDRIMADSVAVLFGRDRYNAAPVYDIPTEKTGF